MLAVVILSLLLIVCEVRCQEVTLSHYHYSTGEIVSVNGSDVNGRCGTTTNNGGIITCTAPTTSVLFDGNVPTLTGLDGDMWASQLLTLNTTNPTVTLVFDFTTTPDYSGVEEVEVVMFNCPEWGISAEDIRVLSVLHEISNNSCDSLVSVRVPASTTDPVLRLEFSLPEDTELHLAEVKFYNRSGTTSGSGTGVTDPGTGVTMTVVIVTAAVAVIFFLIIAIVGVLVFLLILMQSKCSKRNSSGRQERPSTLEKLASTRSAESSSPVDNKYEDVSLDSKRSSIEESGRRTGEGVISDGNRLSATTTDKVEEPFYHKLKHSSNSKSKIPAQQQMLGQEKQEADQSREIYSKLHSDAQDERKDILSHTYTEVDMAKKKKKKLSNEQESTAEYATIDNRIPPKVPEKSEDLVAYLETSFNDSNVEGDGLHSEPTNPPSTNNPRLSPGVVSASNPLSVGDNVYAEPRAPAVAQIPSNGSKERGNAYETIDNETMPTSSLSHNTNAPVESLATLSAIYQVPSAVNSHDRPLEVTSVNIHKETVLGEGNFGQVILAKTVGLSYSDMKMSASKNTDVSILVAIKTLKPDANQFMKGLFQKEYQFMSQLNDPNVIHLLGICTRETTPFIMMEYMENGDLRQHLQKYNAIIDEDVPSANEIGKGTLVHICAQLASGMKYLASKNFIHRDLATRNCLVGDKYHVKISNLGMSRSLYESHYYVVKGHAFLPIRWMASECFYGKFSTKTDVWAFGATMWEIFMLSKKKPYYEMEDRDLVEDACKGAGRTMLSRPEACPEKVFEIMMQCMEHEASNRATFEEVHQMLSSLQC